MILIPTDIKLKLIELDDALQNLGRKLYGRKLYGDYYVTDQFHNFTVELFADGSFQLNFKGNILGSMDHKFFSVEAAGDNPDASLYELEMVISLINNRLKLVSA